MRVIAVGGKALGQIETGRAACDHVEQRRGNDRADHLGNDVRQNLADRKAPARGETDRDGGIEMAAGDVADRIGHGHDAQAECQRHTDQADTDLRKTGGDDRAAASRKSEPERADRLGGIFLRIHILPPLSVLSRWTYGNLATLP
jgi:hypothetical protein